MLDQGAQSEAKAEGGELVDRQEEERHRFQRVRFDQAERELRVVPAARQREEFEPEAGDMHRRLSTTGRGGADRHERRQRDQQHRAQEDQASEVEIARPADALCEVRECQAQGGEAAE